MMTEYTYPNGNGPYDDRESLNDAAEAAREQAERATGTNPFQQFLDHGDKAAKEASRAIEALLPDKFWQHGKEARREMAKGVKVLVDAAVTELEKAQRDFERRRQEAADAARRTPDDSSTGGGNDRPSSTGPQKVKVVVE